VRTGFFDRYCSGNVVLDVGYCGYDNPARKAALPDAIGIDLDFPDYDGLQLPFADASVGTVFSSHCLEHVENEGEAIREWFRVLKVGGFLVCFVPHQALYEKRRSLPSRWNTDHKRFYTPASLIRAVEDALPVNSFRLRHLKDNDAGFDYALGPELHSQGCYEIELVIEKIGRPDWDLA
jgi:SAM-dependent methyltransferase